MVKRILSISLSAAVLTGVPALTSAADTVTCTATPDMKKVATSDSSPAGRTNFEVRISADKDQPPMFSVRPRTGDTPDTPAEKAAAVDRVLLRSPYKSEAIAQAKSFNTSPSGEAVATFELAAVRGLPAGDVNVIVMTADGERLCRLSGKDRTRLFGESTAGR